MTNEVYEVAISEDGTTYGAFESFVPGDVRLLGNFVKFRVTVFGDFGADEYRLRGFAGIVDDATTTTGGFGISPFGRFPFGDGGICIQDSQERLLDGTLSLTGLLESTGLNTDFFGTLELTGELDTVVFTPEFPSGTLSMSGALSVLTTAAESGALAASGALASVLTNPGRQVLFSEGATFSFLGTQFAALSTLLSVSASFGAVQVEIPVATVFSGLAVKLTAALTGTTTVTARYMVNGVVSNNIVVNMAVGDELVAATGTLMVNANDLVNIQIDVANNASVIEQIMCVSKSG